MALSRKHLRSMTYVFECYTGIKSQLLQRLSIPKELILCSCCSKNFAGRAFFVSNLLRQKTNNFINGKCHAFGKY